MEDPRRELQLRHAQELLADHGFWEHQAKGLAVYIDDDARVLPVAIPDDVAMLTTISGTYHVRHLIPSLHAPSLQVLVLAKKEVRLFEGPEATIVRRLRDAGALIAGKTTTTEFAFSEPGGTRNPRDLERTPGGSSSGSAAAVAADLVPVALGTQTVDSIITPAAYCGVVGFKPTYQRMPLDGVIPFSPSMDSGGLFTTGLSAARIVASVVCDSWRDATPASEPVLGIAAAEYVQKAGVQAYDAFEGVIGHLRTNGFATVETSALSNIEAIASAHRRLIAAEFARVHADWYSQYSDRYRPRTASLFAEGAALGYTAVIEGQHSADELCRTLEDIMEIEGITAWVSPSATGVAPLGLDYIGDPIMGLPWTHAHLPVVSLPIPHQGTLPLGIQFTERTGQDEELLDLAHRVEQAMQQDLPAKPPRT